MKNTIKVFGIIAIVAVIGFSFAACGGDDDKDGSDNIVTFNVTANGSATQTTTQLTLTFSKEVPLMAGYITLSGVSGVTKGSLRDSSGQIINFGGSGTKFILDISGFTSGGTLSVTINQIVYEGTTINDTKTVTIYYSGTNSGSSDSLSWTKVQNSTFGNNKHRENCMGE